MVESKRETIYVGACPARIVLSYCEYAWARVTTGDVLSTSEGSIPTAVNISVRIETILISHQIWCLERPDLMRESFF